MADESKTVDTIPASPESTTAKTVTVAPAMHTDTLWEGPRVFDQGDGVPVKIETKTEWKNYVKKFGLRMKDQQESTWGPSEKPLPALPREFSAVVVPPMPMDEAHVYGAVTAIFKRYGIVETVWCDDCFIRSRPHGCRMRVAPKEISLECRCGKAAYIPPAGTTDAVLYALANSAIVETDKTAGTITTAAGVKAQPTKLLQDMEALILKRYIAALRARNKEPRLFHKDCFLGNVHDDDNAMALKITDGQIVMVCQCRTLFHRSTRVDSIH